MGFLRLHAHFCRQRIQAVIHSHIHVVDVCINDQDHHWRAIIRHRKQIHSASERLILSSQENWAEKVGDRVASECSSLLGLIPSTVQM